LGREEACGKASDEIPLRVKGAGLVYVMGPSGAGKDSLMEAAARRLPRVRLARRLVAGNRGSGPCDLRVTAEEFARLLEAGGLLFHWRSHGLAYGIRGAEAQGIPPGGLVLVNGSREYLEEAFRLAPGLAACLVTAGREALRERLLKRGREGPEEIERRLLRGEKSYRIPEGARVAVIDNSGSLERAAREFCSLLERLSGENQGDPVTARAVTL
jgi:ribose 1,5-bisphosphokinase